ncbi:MAG: DNA primase DnaG [Candidatus Woesearchaeota archaeon]
MAKISPISGKYIVHATITIDGVVDRPDIIGAIFGQTEGLLGSELELRELQRSGRIGRIEVLTTSKGGKTTGDITIPSSLDKAETVIVAAALEIIERIGPCNSHIRVQKIEDVRISKRRNIVERAKELLKNMNDTIMPDSQELADTVAESVRTMEITTYGSEKLPAGPGIAESDEIIVVEGRADVVHLLKYGFKNVIGMNGSKVPQTLIDLCKTKTVTVFVDGDRGGLLNIKELIAVTEIDFVTKAPDGKEVEELTQKEIHKALRAKVTPDQMKGELASKDSLRSHSQQNNTNNKRNQNTQSTQKRTVRAPKANDQEMELFNSMLEDLVGSHAALILDEQMNILGKVPLTEATSTIEGLEGGVHAVIVDGEITSQLVKAAEKTRAKFTVGRETKLKAQDSRVGIVVIN